MSNKVLLQIHIEKKRQLKALNFNYNDAAFIFVVC